MSPDRRRFLAAATLAVAGPRPGAGQGFTLVGGVKTLAGFPQMTQPDGISCGPTCCSMVLKWYGIDAGIGPCKTKCGTRFVEAGDWKFGLSVPAGVRDCLAGYGVPAAVHTASADTIRQYLDQDRPCILLVRSAVKSWHYIVATGYDRDRGTFTVTDPGGSTYPMTEGVLDGCWTFSHDMAGKPCGDRKCGICAGDGRLGDGWTKCVACGGDGKVFGGKCPACSGRGKWSTKGAHCVACNGKGLSPDLFRKAVETGLGSGAFTAHGHTMIVPEQGRKKAVKPAPPKPDKPAPPKPVVKWVEYTLRNDSGKTVQATMQPSGKAYTWPPGYSGPFKSEEVDGKAPTLTLTDSGKVFRLTAGNHKLHWMAKENRIGLDLNFDTDKPRK